MGGHLMNKELARGIAQSYLPANDNLNRDQLWEVFNRYLAVLAHCPTCEGSGEFAAPHDLNVDGSYDPIPGGTVMPCPSCQGKGHDPAHTDWHCVLGGEYGACSSFRRQTDEKHQGCGWRISLPIPDLATGLYEPGD